MTSDFNFEGSTAQEYQEKLGGTTSVKTCITPETADRPYPSFLATNQQTGCDYDNLTATTGRLSATLTCQSDDGTLQILLDGASRTDSLMLSEQSTHTAQGEPTIRASANVTAKRDRKSVVEGKGVSVSVDLGGRRHIKKKNTKKKH